MKFTNGFRDAFIVITDVRLAGQSVLPIVRERMIASGQLEDADDRITLLPRESISLDCDEIGWTEI